MKQIYICYLPADSVLLNQNWLNSAAAWFAGTPSDGRSKPMIHVELFFSDGTTNGNVLNGKSCGIHYNGKVFLEPKRFSNTLWQCKGKTVTDAAYNDLYERCSARVGDSFAKGSYFCGLPKGKNEWYCSQLVGYSLRESGIFDLSDDECSHPEKLYMALAPHTFTHTIRDLSLLQI